MNRIRTLICVATLGTLACVNPLSSEAQTTLNMNLFPGLTITGAIGSVYSIQATTNAAQTDGWSTVAVIQLLKTNYVWFDPAFPTIPQRYYRTVAFTNMLTNMVFISAGTFLMGSPTNEAQRNSNANPEGELQHAVTISKGFFMGKYLVTQSNYFAVVSNNPSFFNDPTNFNNPVENLTRLNATNYCNLRTAQELAAGLIPTNWQYRLPTEAEWEYACRAGSTAAFYFGSAIRSGMANFVGTNEYDSIGGTIPNTNGVNFQKTRPVGTYSANGWGLYDMVGNVAQWCNDTAATYPNAAVTDPGSQPISISALSNVRGGSWFDSGSECRSAKRKTKVAGTYDYVGFRVVLVPTQ